MTKEPIMIDDVDVSGCSLYHDGICLNYRTDDGYDKCNAVCDYASYELRQTLKRKEQEFEQYKKSKQASYETMQKEWNEAKNEVKELKVELEKYKQALEEIREIQKDCEGCKGDCCYCYSGSGWIFKLSDEVLKGNFEVLDE